MSVTLGLKWSAIAAENDALKNKVADFEAAAERAKISREFFLEEISELLAAAAIAEARLSNSGFAHLEIVTLVNSLQRENACFEIQLTAEREKSVDLEISLQVKDGICARLEEKLEAQKKVAEKLATGLSVRDSELKDAREILNSKNSENNRLLKDIEVFKKLGAQKDAQIAVLQKRNADALAAAAGLRATLDLQRAARPARTPPSAAELENAKLRKALERERTANAGRARVAVSDNPWDEGISGA